MDTVIPMHEAKSTLSKLVKRAAAGETILIGPRGLAEVKLVAVSRAVAKRAAAASTVPLPPKTNGVQIGRLKGKLKLPAGLFDPLSEDVLRDFEGHYVKPFERDLSA
jgi:antitoxin (DNA-binding transcriptional repressor) of toxin-antitoxin stability system